MIQVDLKQNSPEWLAWRLGGIGGSDAPVVEGLSPYRTPLDLFLEKTGAMSPDESSNEYIFAQGHKTEALIRKEFQALIKADLTKPCIQHSKIEWLRASLDGYHPKYGFLEAKLVGQDKLEHARNGSLPDDHYSQMQHQFAAGEDVDLGQWFGHDGKKNGVLLEVKKNPEYIKRLLELEHLFWEHVQKLEAPPLSDRDYLVPNDLTLLIKLRDAKELAENAQSAFEDLRLEVANLYNHPKIQGAGIKLFKVSKKGTLTLSKVPEIAKAMEIEKAKLGADYLESFRSAPSESWTVQIEKVKKAAANGK